MKKDSLCAGELNDSCLPIRRNVDDDTDDDTDGQPTDTGPTLDTYRKQVGQRNSVLNVHFQRLSVSDFLPDG